MFELSDFFNYCKNNRIDVIPYNGMPHEGATVRDGTWYAIFLDFDKIQSTRLLRGVCYHEVGHAGSGALHKVDSPFETVGRAEARAASYAARRYMTDNDFREAFAAGCRELWELAEYFDLPEEDIKTALSYWTERRGVNFN